MHLSTILLALCTLLPNFAFASPLSKFPAVSKRQSAENPIAAVYPDQITGTENSTMVIVPIDYALARRIVPKKWGILTNAYLSLLPGFPKDKYPVVVRAGLEHGDTIYNYGQTLPDWQNVHIYFPFIDILNDGYSSFIYNPALIISANNPIGIGATATYGILPIPATFSPGPPYAYARDPANRLVQKAFDVTGKPLITSSFCETKSIGPWPLSFFKNITSQPTTGNGISCDNQTDFWATTLSSGANAPVSITGDITAYPIPGIPGFGAADKKKGYTFEGLHGVRADVAFLEIPNVACAKLKGYSGTGSDD